MPTDLFMNDPQAMLMVQNMQVMSATGMLIFVVIMALMYVYLALSFKTMAEKTTTPNSWMAWVPVANLVLMLQIAKRPVWWLLLLIIPFVNLIVTIIVWMDLARACNKPAWAGLTILIPVVNLWTPGYLAFSK